MFYQNLSKEELKKLLGYTLNSEPNYQRIIQRQKQRGIIITKHDKGKETYFDVEIPDKSFIPPKDYILVKENVKIEEMVEIFNYQTNDTFRKGKMWDAFKKKQEKECDRIFFRFLDFQGKPRFDIYEKPSKKNQDLPNEHWKPHPTRDKWLVSNQGRIKRKTGLYILQGNINNGGYKMYGGSHGTPAIGGHRLVLETFDPRPDSDSLFVDHINGIRTDNRLENLRWVFPTKNSFYKDVNQTIIGEKIAKAIQKVGYEKLIETLDNLLSTD